MKVDEFLMKVGKRVGINSSVAMALALLGSVATGGAIVVGILHRPLVYIVGPVVVIACLALVRIAGILDHDWDS